MSEMTNDGRTYYRSDYPALFDRFKELLNLSDEDAETAVRICTETCPVCWENDLGCHCQNDE